MLSQTWYEDPAEVQRVEFMLVRAKVLPEDERDYFRGNKAHKWRKEAEYAERMEQLMMEAGVSPEDGWEMSASDIIDRLVNRGKRRG
jgi:hypothetical protein